MIQQILAIWSLVSLKPAWTSGCSPLMYCWSMFWRILSTTLLAFEMVVWTFFGIAFLWDWNENWCFPVLWPLLSFPNLYSVQFSRSVVSDSLRPHELQRTRPPCPSPTPGVHPNSHPLSQWRHPAISSSVIPFSSCLQSLPASESFLMSQLFAWGGQSTGVSALASFLPKNTQGWSPSEWTGWISLQPKGLSRVFSNTTVQKHQFFSAQPSSQSNSHIHTWPQEKP